jgi:threonine aldolase
LLVFPDRHIGQPRAVHVLAGENDHLLVQHESHFYRDESDAAARLSALNLGRWRRGPLCPAWWR